MRKFSDREKNLCVPTNAVDGREWALIETPYPHACRPPVAPRRTRPLLADITLKGRPAPAPRPQAADSTPGLGHCASSGAGTTRPSA